MYDTMITKMLRIQTSRSSLLFQISLFYIVILLPYYLTHCLNPLQEAKCLSCIRNVTNTLSASDVASTKRCESYYCGQYQLSYSYWVEAGKPGNNQGARDYEKCARDKNCAEGAVRAYFKKFRRDCNNDGMIDCLDMAAVHKVGPQSCSSDWFYKSRYWLAFNRTSCVTNRDQSTEQIMIELEEQKLPVKVMKNESLTQDCLDCICDAVSGCNTGVNNCGSGATCGPFAISQSYWKDGRKPGASWTACSRTKECSMVAVKNYMEKYKRDCNGDGLITCDDYAAIQKRGPQGCLNRELIKDHYWNKFQNCRANQKPNKDVNMVKVNEESDDMMSFKQEPSNLNRDDMNTTPFQSGPGSSSTTNVFAPSTVSSATSTLGTRMINPAYKDSFQDSGHISHHAQPYSTYSIPTTAKTTISSSTSTSTLATSTTTTTTTTTTTPPSATIARMTTTTQQPSSQQVDFLPLDSMNSPAHIQNTEEVEYSLSDFPFNVAPQANLEKTTNFDRVVTGIVGSADFSKSYPPVPEIVVAQDRPLAQDHSLADENVNLGSSSGRSQQRINTNHSRGPTQSISIVSKSSEVKHHMSNSKVSFAPSSNQRPTNDQQNELKTTQSNQSTSELSLNQSLFGLDIIDKALMSNESSKIASECLECICDASSNCDTTVQCISKQREKNRCGLYMISWNQYQESDISLTSLISIPSGVSEETLDERMYYECTTDRSCAEKLIHLYIEKHQKDCNQDGKIDCYDIAAIHRVGPESCNSGKFLSSQYWKDFNICYATDRLSSNSPTTTIMTNQQSLIPTGTTMAVTTSASK